MNKNIGHSYGRRSPEVLEVLGMVHKGSCGFCGSEVTDTRQAGASLNNYEVCSIFYVLDNEAFRHLSACTAACRGVKVL